MILFLIIFVKDIAKIVSGKLLLLKCALKVVTDGRDRGGDVFVDGLMFLLRAKKFDC